MTWKKALFSALILILVLSNLAAAKVFRVVAGEDAEFSIGRAGISFTESHFSGSLHLDRKGTDKVLGDPDLNFTQKLVDARFYERGGNRITHIRGPVYVFFQVRNAEANLWEEGELSIYYWDSWKRTWNECPTFFTADEEGGGRLICRMRIFGLFGLASQ